MIPNDFIQTLLARVDIVQVVDRYVPLRKAGANHVACCPFHREKTPSFTVSESKQFYHCFGCGAHGTAIGFLMEHAGKSFPEAVEDLARDAGLEVPRTETATAAEHRDRAADLSDVLAKANGFYRARLKEAPAAIAYLKSRGLTGAIAARFGIGYAPDAWQPLAAALPDYDMPELEVAGLVIAGEAGKRYDRFRDRIMFPIHDARGQVIGFGGRVLADDEPKYLNSPETPLFSKGRELYGLYLARNAIRAANRVVVVEGYMDVVALAQHGIEYVVATLGTSTTATHAQKLLRLADEVVFCFDGDAAGRKAAWRALENTLPVLHDGKKASFLFLPEGDDPDDFVRARGKDAFEAMVRDALPLSEFMLRELAREHPPTSAERRAALVAAARPLLAQIHAPVLAALLRRRLAELCGLGHDEVRTLLRTNGAAKPAAGAAVFARIDSARQEPSLVRKLLQSLLLQPEAARRVAVPQPRDGTPEGDALSAVVELCARTTGPLTTAGVLQHFASSPLSTTLARALATAEDHQLSAELAAVELEAGIALYWQQARLAGRSEAPAQSSITVEEAERLRQIEAARARHAAGVADSGAGL